MKVGYSSIRLNRFGEAYPLELRTILLFWGRGWGGGRGASWLLAYTKPITMPYLRGVQ